jgi:hypothetical protein
MDILSTELLSVLGVGSCSGAPAHAGGAMPARAAWTQSEIATERSASTGLLKRIVSMSTKSYVRAWCRLRGCSVYSTVGEVLCECVQSVIRRRELAGPLIVWCGRGSVPQELKW